MPQALFTNPSGTSPEKVLLLKKREKNDCYLGYVSQESLVGSREF